MDEKLNFWQSQRSLVFEKATASEGRLKGVIELTLTDTLRPPEVDKNPFQWRVDFDFPTPGDIAGFQPGLIVKMCPHPGTTDAEVTKRVHVDLADAEFPWRYTPKEMNEQAAPPWIVLVVGKRSEFAIENGRIVAAQPTLLQKHDLSQSSSWAHVQRPSEPADAPSISRLVSSVSLEPNQPYVAAIMPAWNAKGEPSWESNGSSAASVPIFHAWEFSTGEPGDFESLVGKLRVRETANVGLIDLTYRRSNEAVHLRGAITTLAKDPPLQRPRLLEMRKQLDALTTDIVDQPSLSGAPARKILGMPKYGQPWLENPDSVPLPSAPLDPQSDDDLPWPRRVNDDPRYRSVAGMGTWLGIEAQEELMNAAKEQSGALTDIADRIRNLALGVSVASSLWNRRLPADPAERLSIFGPTMGRMQSSTGQSVLSRVTGLDESTAKQSPLAAAHFSSAGMRLLRNGTGRTRHLASTGKMDRAGLMRAAAVPPPKPDRGPDGSHRAPEGLPHSDQLVPPEVIAQLAPRLDPSMEAIATRNAGVRLDDDRGISQLMRELVDAGYPKLDCVRDQLQKLKTARIQVMTLGLLRHVLRHCLSPLANSQDFSIDTLVCATPGEPPDRFRPIHIDKLSDIVSTAIDPTQDRSPAKERVRDSIGNLELGNLAPPELPLGLDFPSWQLVNKHARDWLLPGVGTVPMDSIVSLKTNPAFIDAFLIGLNAQFLAEARWRGLSIQRRFTPLRMFWGHVDPKTGKRSADIQPFQQWTEAGELNKDLGDKSHQTIDPRDSSGMTDLVILFRTELFRRYPGTMVYLVQPAPDELVEPKLSEVLKGAPQFEDDVPEPKRYFGPIFMGNISADIVFFAFDVKPDELRKYWLVLDEPPAEMRFRTAESAPFTLAGAFNPKSIDRHTRVAISGEYLMQQAGGV